MAKAKVFESAFERYTAVQPPIGCGGSGTVYEVTDSDGVRLALKLVDGSRMSRQKLKRFHNEIQFCLHPRSTHIVRVLDYGKGEGSQLFCVMPYYPSTLRKQIRDGISPDEVLRLYAQILDSVEAVHLLGACHRDIKPENILYDAETKRLVLADFGIARFKEDDLLTTVDTAPDEKLGNFAYAAPEQRFAGREVDHRADIYALGLILNEMYTGHIPQGTGFRTIKDIAPEYEYLDGFVDKMIQQQPEQRSQSVGLIKEELIGRGNRFMDLQRLDRLRNQVVPQSEISDPLIIDPHCCPVKD
jgi:eukaryotic-like serine/threonine-protein kinase